MHYSNFSFYQNLKQGELDLASLKDRKDTLSRTARLQVVADPAAELPYAAENRQLFHQA